MGLIDNEEAARRLARVILSDIELYQQKKIQAGDDLTAEIEEGRALFQRRVAPALVPLFEAVSATRRFSVLGAPSAEPGTAVAARTAMEVTATGDALAVDAGPADEWASDAPTATSAAAVDQEPPAMGVSSALGGIADAGEIAAVVVAPVVVEPSVVAPVVVEPSIVAPVVVEPGVVAPVGVAPGEETARVSVAGDQPEPSPPASAPLASRAPSDDRVTPIPVEDIVSRPSIVREALPKAPTAAPMAPTTMTAAPPEPPPPVPKERVTVPGAFLAVTSPPEPESKSPPPLPPTSPPPAAAITFAAEPARPASAVKAATPRPVVTRRSPAPGERDTVERTPQPMSAAPGVPSPGHRIGNGTPAPAARVPTPFRSAPFLPVVAPPPAEPVVAATAPDDVVNLRAKSNKLVLLLIIAAVVAGVAGIGRFLTRFL